MTYDESPPSTADDGATTKNPFGDLHSFHDVYTTYADSIYATSLAVLKDSDAARDVVHDVYLKAWEHAEQYDCRRGSVGTWLRTVARNLSIDRLRSSQRFGTSDTAVIEALAACDEPVSRISARRNIDALWAAFERLPPVYREVIDLSFNEQLSHAAIAKRLGQPLGTVKTRIRHALTLVRKSTRLGEHRFAGTGRPAASNDTNAFTTCDLASDVLSARLHDCLPLTVLVVDDDEETVRLVAAVLRKFGVHAETRTSVKAGVHSLSETWPDALLSDLNMPVEDGYSLLCQARAMASQRGRRLPAAAFTCWGSEEERSRALFAGFDMFISKPVHPLALASAVALLHLNPADQPGGTGRATVTDARFQSGQRANLRSGRDA